MRRVVGDAPDIVHAPVKIGSNDLAKLLGVHQGKEIVGIRQNQCRVHRIHPLDGKLHRPAAADHARRGVDRIQPLCADRRFTESRKLRLVL